MSWKKNRFSYLIWYAYALVTGGVLACLAGMLCEKAGLTACWGILFAALYLAAVGGIVFLIHRIAGGCSALVQKHRAFFLVLEAVAAALFIAAGLALRIYGMADAGQTSEYYDAAKVITGQQPPKIAHGAVHFYVQALHAAFLLLGNSFMVGIWLQTGLQFVASGLLFFMVRRLTGPIAALIVFGFSMCAPYMVQSAVLLSPEMLYLVFFLIAVTLTMMGHKKKRNPALFFLAGMLSALCCYMDIIGCLLLLLAFAAIFCSREEGSGTGRKAASVVLCLLGVILGFFVCIFLDALLSGKSIQKVLGAWLLLYQPGKFSWSLDVSAVGSEIECLILFGLMAFGIFSFWCDRKEERLSAGAVAAAGVVLAGCFGIFTAEMPGFIYLYLLFVVLAGVSLEQCFHVSLAEAPNEKTAEEAPKSILGQEAEEEILPEEKPELPEEKAGQVQFLENPLPLPKKHVKRVMDYSRKPVSENDDFDYPVGENDDFDI